MLLLRSLLQRMWPLLGPINHPKRRVRDGRDFSVRDHFDIMMDWRLGSHYSSVDQTFKCASCFFSLTNANPSSAPSSFRPLRTLTCLVTLSLLCRPSLYPVFLLYSVTTRSLLSNFCFNMRHFLFPSAVKQSCYGTVYVVLSAKREEKKMVKTLDSLFTSSNCCSSHFLCLWFSFSPCECTVWRGFYKLRNDSMYYGDPCSAPLSSS